MTLISVMYDTKMNRTEGDTSNNKLGDMDLIA